MKPIAFTKEERVAATAKLRAYFREELDQDLGQLPADMLLDFIGRELGHIGRITMNGKAIVAAIHFGYSETDDFTRLQV